jgi:hypothetical protein
MSITAMKQALEHLDLIFAKSQALTRARDVLREAIEQAEQAQPMADRENSIIRFALYQFMSNAYSHLNAAAQDKDGRCYSPGAVEKFANDAKDAEALLSRLQFTSPPPRQPKQAQPVVNYCRECLTYNGHQEGCSHYTSPPKRKPLTDEQISKLWDEHTCPLFGRQGINPTEFARAIEAAHNIKEN